MKSNCSVKSVKAPKTSAKRGGYPKLQVRPTAKRK